MSTAGSGDGRVADSGQHAMGRPGGEGAQLGGDLLGVVGAVNSETALSYLGLGVKAPDVSLGSILQSGAVSMQTAPWLLVFPSIALVLLTFSMQLIGDGLRDALDPNSRASGTVGA